ncbi:hypothetical protein ACFLX4_01795 [Chloroflexota bacterium]
MANSDTNDIGNSEYPGLHVEEMTEGRDKPEQAEAEPAEVKQAEKAEAIAEAETIAKAEKPKR